MLFNSKIEPKLICPTATACLQAFFSEIYLSRAIIPSTLKNNCTGCPL